MLDVSRSLLLSSSDELDAFSSDSELDDSLDLECCFELSFTVGFASVVDSGEDDLLDVVSVSEEDSFGSGAIGGGTAGVRRREVWGGIRTKALEKVRLFFPPRRTGHIDKVSITYLQFQNCFLPPLLVNPVT